MSKTYSEIMAISQLKKIEEQNGGLVNGNFSFVAAKNKLKVKRVRELWTAEKQVGVQVGSKSTPLPTLEDILLGLENYTRGAEYYEHCYTPAEAKAAIQRLIAANRQETEKAYGGCHRCYGKGYATQKSEVRARGLRWDTSGIKFCECARGKQLELVIAAERLEELKQVKLYNELTRIGVEEVDRRIIELQQQIKAKES